MAKKLQLTYKEIEDRLRVFRDEPFQKEDIGYKLLWAFGKPEREIERYREGKGVIKTFDGLLIKGLFCYKTSTTLQFATELDTLKSDPQVVKSAPKIIAVSDGQTIRAYDTRERNTFEQQVTRLFCDFEFFYPLAGVERVEYTEESPADIKAAEKLARLHDEIRAYNEFTSDTDLHDLNTFIARLLFCFFAEDTGIFPTNSFTHAIQQYSHDGITLKDVLEQLFRFMGGKSLPDGLLRTYCQEHFAFVGGGLFERDIYIPQLSFKARQIIIDSGELNWQDINPDIFGSMIQAVVNPDVRANQGMHYTSVPNIMKVINPLFMDELNEEYAKIDAAQQKAKEKLDLGACNMSAYLKECAPLVGKLDKLLLRMGKMKFFDPACGSGNFLIITYKSLRLLEMKILRLRMKCNREQYLQLFGGSAISLNQFYGIELLDFPHEVAMLSLWLAEHQMNKRLMDDFGVNTQALPLKDINHIRCANACRVDWNEVCPHAKEEEVFVFGNPPYLGSSMQDEGQKADMTHVCGHFQNYKNLDYIACWFYLGSLFIKGGKGKYAFVSTNSICQGDSVALLWPNILDNGVEIEFAYQSFKWTNNAKHVAAVIVVIIGLSCLSRNKKTLFDQNEKFKKCDNINAYLLDGPNIIIGRLSKSISGFPEMVFGNKPSDGGFLILEKEERDAIVDSYPQAKPLIKQYHGADSYINGGVRYCLWITDDELALANSIPPVRERIEGVRDFRSKSKADSTAQWAEKAHMFKQRAHKNTDSIIFPSVSSERRLYIPTGLLTSDTVISNAAYAVYDADLFIFGILNTRIHVIWIGAVGGKMKSDYRYSSLVYNSFPFPTISDSKRTEIEEAATDILLAREPYLTMGKTLADLYDPDTMPADLKAAHERLDGIVESCYPGAPFASDEARLECLFKLYEKMTSKK
ncbi:MAG: class I SAM-dependent DNA methyltransferase [Bacteroidales bacterium]|nr:class I SAM-dependent DNA methyltransferase [Bacteroidales bacterium]